MVTRASFASASILLHVSERAYVAVPLALLWYDVLAQVVAAMAALAC